MKQTRRWHKQILIGLSAAVLIAGMPFSTSRADTYDDQITQLQAEAEGYRVEATKLRSQAETLQNEIGAINAQQQSVRAQIAGTEARLQQLNNEIANTELRIANVREALTQNLRSIYLEGDDNALLLVASCDTISQCLDKQEARNKINESIQKNIKTLKDLKSSLATQKAESEQVLADQNAMREDLTAQENTKNNILTQTQGQEENYQLLVKQKDSEVASLREKQRAANLKAYSGSIDYSKTSEYPWPNVSMNYDDGCRYADGSLGADPWGYCYRQCTSYVAWHLAKDGASDFSGLGNAGSWAFSGQPINPHETEHGDVLILPIGYYGHVMYVESRTEQGIYISEFNYGWDGRYSERLIPWNQVDSSGYKVRRF